MNENTVALDTDVSETSTVRELSTAELLHIAWQRCDRELYDLGAGEPAGDTKREFALAKTHIEDAITRVNKGIYRKNGTYAVTDAERASDAAVEGEVQNDAGVS